MLNLTFRMLKLFAEGTLPATLVQELASAAVQDGWGSDDEVAQSLAKMGAAGRHKSNILRDLLRISKRLGMEEATPEPYYLTVPGPDGTEKTVSVILPVCTRSGIHSQVQGVKFTAIDQLFWSMCFVRS